MPHVLEEPDVLEEDLTLSPACDELHTLPLGQPAAPRESSPLLTFLRRLPRLWTRRQDYCHSGARRFEAPLDKLAREQLDIYLLVMGGIG